MVLSSWYLVLIPWMFHCNIFSLSKFLFLVESIVLYLLVWTGIDLLVDDLSLWSCDFGTFPVLFVLLGSFDMLGLGGGRPVLGSIFGRFLVQIEIGGCLHFCFLLYRWGSYGVFPAWVWQFSVT